MSALEAVFMAVIDASWRATCLILVVFALRRWLRGRVAARVLFWAWLAVALRLLLPVSARAMWSPFNLTPWRHGHGDAAGSQAARGAALVRGGVAGDVVVEPADGAVIL